ncbi:hypothetical protein OOT33_01010 [Sphingobium sp. DEHP117]|uniref:hypothetical protein n=1 Tax=Sphingobium sp. DEHP117 TaxID=2993436 RepID=UPI0027D71536|nr:hypothetical protein [Sphingobium sp. DEHP117]MDQ4419028.1 hypothetical protein [Sphingobium sp. DEHP117]
MEQERHIEAEAARSGATRQNVRYVLAISLALIVLAFIAVYFWGGGSTGEETQTISTATPAEQTQP